MVGCSLLNYNTATYCLVFSTIGSLFSDSLDLYDSEELNGVNQCKWLVICDIRITRYSVNVFNRLCYGDT